uniref:Clusterin n=1 Tax=Poecilia latipinna TaxID=48699 RepID=A0A3B3VAW3_9TELE
DKLLLFFLFFFVITMKNLKSVVKLSEDGEKLVNEEMKRALYGVKQMREVMWRNEQKHEHLLNSLKHSGDKKKVRELLAKDVSEKLEEAEEQCKDSLQSEWEECRPCLEDVCKSFYTSTCRRGFASFRSKVETFFQRVSRRFGPRERPLEAGDILVNQSPDESEPDVVQIENSFKRVMSKVGTLVNCSIALVSRMSSRLDGVLQKAFLNTTNELSEDNAPDPYYPGRDSGFLQGVGLEEVLESFFDFGRSVVEEFGAVVTQVFDDIHQTVEEETKRGNSGLFTLPIFRTNVSSCFLFTTECPSVRELHVELDEISQLLDVSKQQYDEILSIVQHHTDETVKWLTNMAAEFSWVAQAVSNSSTPQNVFRITMVSRQESHEEQNMSATETKVEVNVLNSPQLTLNIPGELELHDPAFIQYVAQEALDKIEDA